MTWHDYNGYSWCECDSCGAVISGERPDYVGEHMVKTSHNICNPRCEKFCEYDSNGNIVKYKGKPIEK